MKAISNEEVIRRSFAEWNRRNPGYFLEVTTADYALHSPSNNPNPISKWDAVKTLEAFWAGFPDIQFRIEDLITAGDRVIVRFVGSGTHRGEFMGIPATGKKIEVSALTIARIENGKVAEEWEELDVFGLLKQIGGEVVPKK